MKVNQMARIITSRIPFHIGMGGASGISRLADYLVGQRDGLKVIQAVETALGLHMGALDRSVRIWTPLAIYAEPILLEW